MGAPPPLAPPPLAAAASVASKEERTTHDDFFALQASRHNDDRQCTPSLRVKRSIYIAVISSFCAFTIIFLSISMASMKKGEYANDHNARNLTFGKRHHNESNLSRVEQRWNNSSSSSQNEEVTMSIIHASTSEESEQNGEHDVMASDSSSQFRDRIEQQQKGSETEIVQLQQSDGKKSRHIWIDVITYAEGIAGWKTSLLELLHLARSLHATLVEPCMESGRLRSCGGGGGFNIPVSEIFDLAEYMVTPPSNSGSKFPLMTSYDYYQKALDDSDSDVVGMLKLCLLSNAALPSTRCSANTTRIKEMERNDIKKILNKAKDNNFILHMEDYWRGSIGFLGKQLGRKFPDKDEFASKVIPFHPNHLQFVDDLLQKNNMTSNNFSVIHWRAEKEGMNFTRCARAINSAKRIILKNMTSNNIAETGEEESKRLHKFVLLSSLNEDPNRMWSGSKTIANGDKDSVRNALRYLLQDNGFIKIDKLLGEEHKLRDSGMLAIYDLIIATKANNFASCARNGVIGCTKSSQRVCEECNHVGKFGQLATLIRRESVNNVGSSWECWPTE